MAASATTTWEAVTADAGSGPVRFAKAGSGPAVLVLGRDNGHAPSNAFLDSLAVGATVYQPWYPGFHGGGSPADWSWLGSPRDLAVVILQAAGALGLDRFALAGFGFGGWLAAEIASVAGARVRALALVAPFGIRPPEGYIYDQFIGSTETYARLGFAEDAAFDAVYGAEPSFEQLESWETDREMTSRLAWKPYMHNRSLPGLLRGVAAPALVVWGESDQVIPAGTAALWRAALPNARIETLAGTGHAADLEQPLALASLVEPFFATH